MRKSEEIQKPIPAYIWGLVVFALILVCVAIASAMDYIKLELKLDALAITAIPLFIVTIIELARTHRLQTAELVRSHISEFLSNDQLNGAFHELIYRYSDEIWRKVKSSLPGNVSRDDIKTRTPEKKQEVWKGLELLNAERALGTRFYDPDFFQGSTEEQHLDAVLHYFDVLAYNYRRGLISLRDIRGVSGYHLAVIGSREVIQYYLAQNKAFWDNLPYKTRIGAEPPFENLRLLLAAIKRFNQIKTGVSLTGEST